MKLYDLMINSAWCILPEKLNEILRVVESKQSGELNELEAKLSLADAGQTENSYTVKNGIAVLKIYGTLAKKMNLLAALSGCTSYEMAGKDFQKALSDPAVKTIVLDVDSPGGNVSGLLPLANLIYESRSKKRIISFANSLAASAAYYIASAAHEVVLSDKSAQAGSLGVIGIHMDRSKEYEQKGIKPTVLKAGKLKAVGNEYNPLSKDDQESLQSHLDYLYGIMIQDIARNRGVTVEVADKKMGQGKIFIGQQSVDFGLANRIESWDRLLAGLKGKSNNANTTGAESKRRYINMQTIKNYDLKSLAENITEAADLPGLKAIEDACLLHFSEKAKTATNWIAKAEAKTTGRKVAELVDLRRRQLLALPKIQKDAEEYALGKIIGKK